MNLNSCRSGSRVWKMNTPPEGASAIERALRTTQHLDALEVDEAYRRRYAEVRDHEGHIVEVVADGGIAVGIAAPAPRRLYEREAVGLALPFEGTGNGADEVADAADVLFLPARRR